ncbi:MAG: hypothetical protein E6K18_05985 [Methanobacteriota archaeon]|nr:MAG: hypothetical protein E6K18_05985 [Euryarchaeota archaeon]
MADPLAIAFEALLAGIAILLLVSSVSFRRMNAEVRRARLFVMGSRIERFLLAFTVGFLAIVITFFAAFAGITLPPAIGIAAIFFWLGAVLWGSTEILLVARPNLLRTTSPLQRRNGRGAP